MMDSSASIRVLIVDDSPTQRHVLARLIDSTRDLTVIGQASDGMEAIEMAERLRPDVISMDLRMPRLDGLSATRHIMSQCPTPIVVVSTAGKSAAAMELLRAGALAAVEKLPALNDAAYDTRAEELLKMLRLMAGVRVIRHWNSEWTNPRPPERVKHPTPAILAAPDVTYNPLMPPSILAIGASAGGPRALEKLLRALPKDFPLPILLVQHLSAEFVGGLAEWLDRSCDLSVRMAQPDEVPQPGVVYVASGGFHLRVSAERRLVLDSHIGHYRHCPAVDALLTSVAEVYGARAIGVILTGMGDDGAEGLLALRNTGGRTVAEDESSCVVFGMPAAAIAKGAAEYILPLSSVGPALLSLAGRSSGVNAG